MTTNIDQAAQRERAIEDNTPEPVIDWKRRAEKAISDGIQGKAKVSEKLRQRDQELNTANLTIAKLEDRIRKLEPAATKLRKLQDDHEAAMVDAARKIQDYRQRVLRGQRGALEDVIADLQDRARRLPAPVPGEAWEA